MPTQRNYFLLGSRAIAKMEHPGSRTHKICHKLILVGGLVAIWIIFPEILGCIHHPNWRSPSFFRGVAFKTTNQWIQFLFPLESPKKSPTLIFFREGEKPPSSRNSLSEFSQRNISPEKSQWLFHFPCLRLSSINPFGFLKLGTRFQPNDPGWQKKSSSVTKADGFHKTPSSDYQLQVLYRTVSITQCRND